MDKAVSQRSLLLPKLLAGGSVGFEGRPAAIEKMLDRKVLTERSCTSRW